jgi:hypothetical protein
VLCEYTPERLDDDLRAFYRPLIAR